MKLQRLAVIATLAAGLCIPAMAQAQSGARPTNIRPTNARVRPKAKKSIAPKQSFKVQHNAATTQQVSQKRQAMTASILRKSTPPFAIVPRPGVNMVTLRNGNYKKSIVPQIKVTGIGSAGKLDATVLAPVSGHVGVENAQKWAKSDTYTISYQHGNGPRQVLAKNVKSTDLVSAVDVQVPLKQGEVTKIFYDRSGSAGVAGFPSGRTLEVVWDGN